MKREKILNVCYWISIGLMVFGGVHAALVALSYGIDWILFTGAVGYASYTLIDIIRKKSG